MPLIWALALLVLTSTLAASCTVKVTSPTRSRVVIASPVDVQTMDIHNHQHTFTETVHSNMFDYLIFRDKDMELKPALAERWEALDEVTWRFWLRKGVQFHNGEPFDAESVKFTLERVATDKALNNNANYKIIKEVKIIDPYTVDIITSAPDPILPNRISRTGSGMLPAKYFASVGLDGFIKNPVGTGPYAFVEWVKDDYIRLKANTSYWRGRPAVGEIVFRVIPEDSTRVAELLSGGVDIIQNVPPQDAARVNTARTLSTIGPTGRVMLFYVRLMKPYATADLKVRTAIDLAINRTGLVQQFLAGAGTPVRTRLLPGCFGYDPSLYGVDVYNPDRARELLQEAGYVSGGPEIGILSAHNRYTAEREIMQAVASMLDEVGFKTKLELLDSSAYTKKVNANEHPELYMTALTNSMFDGALAFDYLRKERSFERLGYDNPEYDALVLAAANNMDLAERRQQYQTLGQFVADQRLQIFLFQMDTIYGLAKRVKWQPRLDELIWVYDLKLS